ncbi:MAG: undecaprenyldiphospho-muramoylpentapeptide beta-N-acetylglucosaminyltransferase [Bacteroidetes bacterium]|nr:undecaprenyldiphospho-muramoylpentapeptide beta-N-acetylglucosaminyltransferase [Bacteroidota bacterium]
MNSKNTKLSFLISGGGTGGHVFPAIAIGQALKQEFPESKIEFVGAKGRMEMKKVPEAGFRIHGLWISGIHRKLTPKNLSFPFKVIDSLIKSRKIIKKNKPAVAIGVGGYASGPLLFMAAKMKIPTLILEPNGFPGITNRWLGSSVNTICVALPGMDRFFDKEKIVLTGNPIRQDILTPISKEDARHYFGLDSHKPTLLIIGGSLGARSINSAVKRGLEKLKNAGIQIIWQTGSLYKEEHEVPGVQQTFIRKMREAYGAADLVISRAGASSLSEICALGKAAILVPSPNVAEDHQTKNAVALIEQNAAVLVKDSHAKMELIDTAIELIKDAQKLSEMQSNALKLALPNAPELIVAEIRKLMK